MKVLPVHYDADNDEALKEFENEKGDFGEDDGEDSDEELLKETVTEPPQAEATGKTSTGKKTLSTLQKVCIHLRNFTFHSSCSLITYNLAPFNCHEDFLITSTSSSIPVHCH